MIVGIYSKILDFETLFRGYTFQEEIIRIRLIGISTFEKEFDSMI